MKRKIILSIALVLTIVLISLTSSDSRVGAQNQIRVVADTGVVLLGPNQKFVLTVVSGTPTANGTFSFRVRRLNYTQQSCGGGVCKQTIASQTLSDLVTLAPSEAASISSTPDSFDGVRAVVIGNGRDVKVNAMIIDTLTGEVVSFTTDVIIDISG